MDAQQSLAERYARAYPGEAAVRLEAVPTHDVAEFLTDIEPETAAEVVEAMLPSSAAAAFELIDQSRLRAIVERLSVMRCALVLRSVEITNRRAMIGLLPKGAALKLEKLLRSADGTAGVLAEPIPYVLSPGMDVTEARQALEGTSGSYAYVVNEEHRLVGVVHRRDLSKNARPTQLNELMSHRVVKLPTGASLATVRNHRAWDDFETLPVVDTSGVLVGVIRHRNLRRSHSMRRSKPEALRRTALETLLDLGEVYWTGLASVVESLGNRETELRVAEVKGDE
jgi:magnesium transporter